MPNYDTADNIIRKAAQELGLGAVSAASPTDETGYQALGLLNALCDEVYRVHDWQNLERTMTFTGDGATTTFPLPTDFGRQVNQTAWAENNRRPMLGPVTPQVWGWLKYGIVSSTVFFQYRILDNEYNVFPVPGLGDNFTLFYISKMWCQKATDPVTYDRSIAASTDIPLFDDRMLICGLKVKLWAAKGFDTTLLQTEFDYLLNAEKGQNQGAAPINLSNNYTPGLIGWGNVTDGSWNQ